MFDLTSAIKNEGYRLGFSKIGIAKVERLTEVEQLFKQWLNNGYHGTMNWLVNSAEQRIDPREILPDAKSIIVTALNYYTKHKHSSNTNTGKISRYAWGKDYHLVLQKRLKQLLEFIKSHAPQTDGKIFVDTGPVMEKVWAQRAGLGWQGKHTILITEKYGSWIFLGVIILNIQLQYDKPETDQCGDCNLCIQACPTNAIVEPYVLDSNRCISYLTIEHREDIPENLGNNFDRWIYGCDTCQDVCPWNQKFNQETEINEFVPDADNINPSLESLAKLSKHEFRKRFKHTAIMRTTYNGFIRNVNFILKHSGQNVYASTT